MRRRALRRYLELSARSVILPFDRELGGPLLYEAGRVPGDIGAGDAREGEAALENALEGIADLAGRGGDADIGLFKCLGDGIDTVIGGGGELIERGRAVFFGLFFDEIFGRALGCLGIEMRKEGNFLRNGIDVKAFH